VTDERNLNSFFRRAHGRHAQAEHDRYITELANLQSILALKSGKQFCKLYSGTFDEVMPLSTSEELATYARRKPIQQAMAAGECAVSPAPTLRGKQ
jgi:hypothetical protein